MAQAATRYPTLQGPAPQVVLGTCWRYGQRIGAAAGRVVARIGALGPGTAARRAPQSAAGLDPGRVSVQVSRSSAAEASAIASTLRAAHLRDGLPWSQMAVLVRSAGQTAALR